MKNRMKQIKSKLRSFSAVLHRLRNARKGTTLVESICGLLILTIVFASVYTGIMAAQSFLKQGDELESKEQNYFSLLEAGNSDELDEWSGDYDMDGIPITLTGTFVCVGTADDKSTIYAVETIPPDPDFALDLRDTYIHWYKYWSLKPLNEIKAAGMAYWGNTPLRDWLKSSPEAFGGFWPKAPESFCLKYGTPGAPNTYLQVYCEWKYDIPTNCFVYINDRGTEQTHWNVTFVYDHEEKEWYKIKKSSYGIVGKSWAAMKEEIHSDRWVRVT